LQETQQQMNRSSSSSKMVRQAVRPRTQAQVGPAVPLLLWVFMRLQEQLLCSRQQTTAAHQQQQ
jgi:hypothetical protein